MKRTLGKQLCSIGVKSYPAKVYMTGGWVLLVALSLLAVSANLPNRTEGAQNSRVIRVSAGGDLQSAIDRAGSGDTIELEAGAKFGQIILPAKALSDFVTIRTSAIQRLSEGKRISPADRQHMARIVTRNAEPAVKAARGAHHYRFIGVEITSETSEYIYNLVQFGDERSRIDVPHHLEIDRSFIHAGARGIVRRGLALNSSDTVVRDSCFIGFAFPDEETQGIAGWTGTRNVKILNNYIEGGAENIMFGGSDPASAELIPSDIEIRSNHLKKPASWKGRVSMKTLFELKNTKRVIFEGNFLEDGWLGSAMRITVRNQDGRAPFSTIEDVTIQNNVVSGAGDGINILGKDDTYPSGTIKNLRISGNLLVDIGGEGFEGSGYFVQISGGENITIERNTSFNSGNTFTFHGDFPKALTVRDNVIGHGEYGVHGLADLRTQGARMFSNNLIFNSMNLARGDLGLAPGSVLIDDIRTFGFTDAANRDFTFSSSSRFKGKGAGGADIGAAIVFEQFKRRTVF